MKTRAKLLELLTVLIAWQAAFALGADPAPVKATMGIGAVKVTPSVREAAQKAGTLNQMNRVVEAMDAQLMSCMNDTRKFALVSRSDLKDILGEQKLVASGNVDADDNSAAKAFALAGCKYLLVTTVDNFQDYEEKAHFEGGAIDPASRLVVQFSAVGKIYDTTTGKVLETANFQMTNNEVERNPAYVSAKGDLKEELFVLMSRSISEKIANRVIDVLFPAKIIARTDRIVTINRGQGTNVAEGQVWEAFALGAELTDPDTGASLGHEEIKVGTVKITSVQPLFCKGEVQEDHGVDKGQIVRLVADHSGDAGSGRPGDAQPAPR